MARRGKRKAPTKQASINKMPKIDLQNKAT
jgi:hypothetical protein